MSGADCNQPFDCVAQRLAARISPSIAPVMYQRWSNLLFLHWEYPAKFIQQRLPEGLFADTFRGKAYLGVVPFFMEKIRPRFLPAVRGLSNFMELNLRTYVHDQAGVPGVWFFSLEANQWLAVEIAKRFFHLPYEHASMRASHSKKGCIGFESLRKGTQCTFEYAAGEALALPAPDSLEFFLLERYRLYSSAPDGLRRGAVYHEPYPLRRADVTLWDENLLLLNGFALTKRPPDHMVISRGVDVSIFPLERLKKK